MTWIRFVLAVAYGVWISIQPASSARNGAANLIFAFNIVCFIPLAYTISYLRVDQESYGANLLFAGVPQGIALVLLIWVYIYTEAHQADEMVFAAILQKGAALDGADPSTDSSSHTETMESAQAEESEF